MTAVLIDIRTPSATGVNRPARMVLEWVPTLRRTVAGYIALPSPFLVTLVDGAATVALAATEADWCWKVTEHLVIGNPLRSAPIPPAIPDVVRFVAVPESAASVSYSALVDVDPAVFAPIVAPPSLGALVAAALVTVQASADAAVADVASARTTATTAVTTAGAAQVTLATTQADRAKTEADRATSIVTADTDAAVSNLINTTTTTTRLALDDLYGGATAVTKADVGLGNVDNTADLAKPISTATQSVLVTKADLVGGLVPTSQIPAVALTNVIVVASQAAMLALTSAQVQPGDVAARSDGAGTFMLAEATPATLSSWVLLNSPTDKVVSVNGQVGTIVLSAANVGADAAGAAAAAQAFAIQRGNATGSQTAATISDFDAAADARVVAGIGGKAPLASPTFTGTVAGITSAMVGADPAGAAAAAQAAAIAAIPAAVPAPFTQTFTASGALTVKAGVSRLYNNTGRTLTIQPVTASVGTAPTGATLIADVLKNGTTIFTTTANRPTIAVSGFTATSAPPNTTAWAAGEYLTVNVAQVGSTVAGSDLTVQVTGK